jgi:DNA-binding CsgD family transcriptional regulator
MRSMSHDTFDRIVDEIYEAATDETLWSGVIRKVAEFSGGFGGGLNLWDTANHTFPAYYQAGFSEEYCKLYSEEYLKFDPRPHAMMKLPQLELYTDAMLFADELRPRHEFFDWERRHCDTRFGYGARLIKNSRLESMLVLARTQAQGPASLDDLERLQLFVPHLRRSIAVARKVGERLAKETLDALPFGIVVLDEAGRVVLANSAISAMAAKRDGLALSLAGLVLTSRRENEALQRLVHLHQTRSYSKLDRQDPGLLALRPSGARPYAIMVHPLRRNAVVMPGLHNAVMICVTDPEDTSQRTAARLGDLFDFTPSEAALCAALVQSGTLADAAAACGLTSGSARQYMKRIFAKTNTRGQVELVALIMGSVRI